MLTGDWLAALLIGATLLKDGLSCRIQPFLLLGKLSGALVVIAVLRTAAFLLGATQNGARLGVPLAGVANAALTDLWQTALVWLTPKGFAVVRPLVIFSRRGAWRSICAGDLYTAAIPGVSSDRFWMLFRLPEVIFAHGGMFGKEVIAGHGSQANIAELHCILHCDRITATIFQTGMVCQGLNVACYCDLDAHRSLWHFEH